MGQVRYTGRVESIKFIQAPSASRTGHAFVEFLLLCVWLGSMLFFSFAVAPSAFASLAPQKELAARVVTSTLSKVELIGMIAGPLLIISILLESGGGDRKLFLKKILPRIVLTAAMVVCAVLSRYVITPTMVAIRSSWPDTIDSVAPSDPLRIKFDDLHQYSVALMSVAMLAGLVLLLLTARNWLRQQNLQNH
jgi:hypothetical protein